MDIDAIPIEIITDILKKLIPDTKSILAARLVCRKWYTIIQEREILKGLVLTYTLKKNFNRCTDFTLVQWLKCVFDLGERHIQFESNALFLQSIENETLPVFDWFIDHIIVSSSKSDEENIRTVLCKIIDSGSTLLFRQIINKLRITKKWFKRHVSIRSAALQSALCKCNQEVVTHLLDTWNLKDASQWTKIIWDVFLHSAARGDLQVMQWLRNAYLSSAANTDSDVGRAMYTALANVRFEVCKWLKQEFDLEADDIPWENDYSFVTAVVHEGNLAMLKWIQQSFFSFGDGLLVNLAARLIIPTAVRKGHIDILKWAYEKNRNACIRAVSYISAHLPDQCPFLVAAECGQFDIIQWIYTNFAKPTNKMKLLAFYRAVENGHLDIVKWLSELMESILQSADLRSVITCSAVIDSSSNGRLDVLKWLHDQYSLNLDNRNSPISYAFYGAARSEHIDTLQWLKDMYDVHHTVAAELYSIATDYANLKVLEWMKQQNLLPTESPESVVSFTHSKTEHLDITAWLIDAYSITRDQIAASDIRFLLRQSIEYNDVENLEFFEQASIITVDDIRDNYNLALRYAVCLNNERIVRWLISTFSLTAADITETGYTERQEIYSSYLSLYFHCDNKISKTGDIAKRTKSALTIAIEDANVDILQYFVAVYDSCKQEIQKQRQIFFQAAVTRDLSFAIEWYQKVFGLNSSDLQLINETTVTVTNAGYRQKPCFRINQWLAQNVTEDCEHQRKRRRKE